MHHSQIALLITGLVFIVGALGVLVASARRRRHDRQLVGVTAATRPVPPGLL